MAEPRNRRGENFHPSRDNRVTRCCIGDRVIAILALSSPIGEKQSSTAPPLSFKVERNYLRSPNKKLLRAPRRDAKDGECLFKSHRGKKTKTTNVLWLRSRTKSSPRRVVSLRATAPRANLQREARGISPSSFRTRLSYTCCLPIKNHTCVMRAMGNGRGPANRHKNKISAIRRALFRSLITLTIGKEQPKDGRELRDYEYLAAGVKRRILHYMLKQETDTS